MFWLRSKENDFHLPTPGADPGFLERQFIYIKVCVCGGGGHFVDFISFFLNIP